MYYRKFVIFASLLPMVELEVSARGGPFMSCGGKVFELGNCKFISYGVGGGGGGGLKCI